MKYKLNFLVLAIIGVIVIGGAIFFLNDLRQSSELAVEDQGMVVPWIDTELKDVRTRETFRISDFKGKPVLIESFAVWCPTCTKQQKEIKKLHKEIGDSVVSISIDTDPNEDESKILNHIQENGLDWYYAVSPVEMTKSLIDEFGNGIVNAPSAPMILICDDLSYRKLGGFSVRSPDKLKEEIERGC